VLVAAGTYVETIDFDGKAILVKSESGAEATTIDGNRNGSVVSFMSGEGLDSIIDGFTLTNGLWIASIIGDGAGVGCHQASPTIRNNIITRNEGQYGGGIYCHQGAPLIHGNIIHSNTGGGIGCGESDARIEKNTISENEADFGGGINCWDGSPHILHNTIVRNAAREFPWGLYTFGGGISAMNGAPVIEGNLIAGNTSSKGSGGMHFENASGRFASNLVIDNSAFTVGGIGCDSQSAPVITNCTLHGNEGTWAGGFLSADFSAPSLANVIIWENPAGPGSEIMVGEPCGLPSTLSIAHSDLKGGKNAVVVNYGCTLDWGPGMIDADPLFVDPAADDFHLTFPSPCRNAGDNGAAGLPAVDFEGDPRIASGTVDMGADEFYRHLYYTGDATPASQVGLHFVGTPGDAILLFVGSGVLDPPLSTVYGDWYLRFPLLFQGAFGFVPQGGVASCLLWISSSVPSPWDIPMQAGIGMKLTNLCVMKVR
jgi:hypothetical protein